MEGAGPLLRARVFSSAQGKRKETLYKSKRFTLYESEPRVTSKVFSEPSRLTVTLRVSPELWVRIARMTSMALEALLPSTAVMMSPSLMPALSAPDLLATLET